MSYLWHLVAVAFPVTTVRFWCNVAALVALVAISGCGLTPVDDAHEARPNLLRSEPAATFLVGLVEGDGTTSTIADFRQALGSIWAEDHLVVQFIAATDDERLNELQHTACTAGAGHEIEVEIDVGSDALFHLRNHLTPQERSLIGSETHPELYGSLIGWFCPERLALVSG